jgi:competence protein ComEA
MALRPIVRALVVPVLGLSLSGIAAHPAVAEGDAGAPPATHKTVNINQAGSAELARLPRVGAKLAERIVAHRSQHGPFKRIEDLMEVKGVGEKLFVVLRPHLTVSGNTTLTQKVKSTGTRSRSRTKAAKAA